MWTSQREMAGGASRGARRAWHHGGRETWWSERREASLNWLALGILLAAWNAADDGSSQPRRRPEALRRYGYVSVRAATLHASALQAGERAGDIDESMSAASKINILSKGHKSVNVL